MRRALRGKLTYANVMSTLAVFLVLGGGTALAAYVVNSNADVGPNTISGHKPPTGDQANIIAGSVNGKDLSNNSVTSSKVADGSLTGADLAANSVTGSNVLDGSLTAGDIAGAIPTAFATYDPSPNTSLGSTPFDVLDTVADGSPLVLPQGSRVLVHATE